jgi:hypothetical protein
VQLCQQGEFGLEGTGRVLVAQVQRLHDSREPRRGRRGGPLEWGPWGYNTARARCSEAAPS